MQEEMSKEKIEDILTNIIYVGIPPFEQIIKEEEWIKAAKRMVEEKGLEEFLRKVIKNLRTSYENVVKEGDLE